MEPTLSASSLRRSETVDAHTKYHHEQSTGNHLELDADLFTNAFVSSLGMPSNGTGGPALMKSAGEMGCSVGALLSVTLIQVLMAWAVYLHVENDLILTKTRPLLTAFEMFIGTNITMPLGTVESLCGKWEDQEMKEWAQGPLSTMNMPDGSVYGADESYSFFYNLKQPTRSWDYGRLGSERSVLDDVMFVLSEGVTFNPATPSGYSLLFILVLAIFFFSIFVEIRQISQFTGMLGHFITHNSETDDDEVWRFNKDSETFQLQRVPWQAQIVGFIAMLCRTTVALCLLGLGFVFLLFTSLKIDLILNGLAILFVLELDKVIFFAIVPAQRQRFIKDIEPILYKHAVPPGGKQVAEAASYGPILLFPLTFGCAVAARAYQCHLFLGYFRMTAAVCLFAGPTIPFGRTDIIGPVAGFCDSLLGVSCAPRVEPAETATRHGYCVITDQTTMTSPTIQFYLDDPSLFETRVNEDGTEKSWTDWGVSNKQLFESKHWMNGPYQDLLRKNCLQLYQKDTKPDDVLVDDDVGETMDGAPFYCNREPMFEAMFGEVSKSVDKLPTRKAIQQIRDLNDPKVVEAMDHCKDRAEEALKKKKKEAKKEKKEKKEEASPTSDEPEEPADPDSTALYVGDHQHSQQHKHHRVDHLRKGHRHFQHKHIGA